MHRREGEVIAARTPILSIFNPLDTYAVVFFDPGDRSKLFRGQDFDVSVQGMASGVTATLTDFYPELSALPSSLTRFLPSRKCGRNTFRLGSILRTLSPRN